MHRGWKVVAVIALVAFALLATGCERIIGAAVEKGVEDATGVSVDKDGENVTIKTEEGQATFGEGAELPDGFPEDVPVYDGKITTSLKADEGFSVGIETTDSAGAVFDWYKEELESGGWTIKNEVKTEAGVSLGAEKGDLTFVLSAGGDSDEGKTTLVISVQKKK